MRDYLLAYHTTENEPTFGSLTDKLKRHPGDSRPFPTHLDPFVCTRYEISNFTKEAFNAGVRYFGVCCGAAPYHIRAMADALKKKSAANKYNEDMSQHFSLGTDKTLLKENQQFANDL